MVETAVPVKGENKDPKSRKEELYRSKTILNKNTSHIEKIEENFK
jgi:hypothetical protein